MRSTARKSVLLASAGLGFIALPSTFLMRSEHDSQPGRKMPARYEATFAVPLKCESCHEEVKKALDGLHETELASCSVSSNLVVVRTSEAPSRVISAIQSTGRSAIMRGSGRPESAAVCILESHVTDQDGGPGLVRGLARFIELSESMTMLDLTLTGLRQGRYRLTLRSTGDISRGADSMGPEFTGLEANKDGELAKLSIDEHGKCNLNKEVDWRVWELIGRGLMIEPSDVDVNKIVDSVENTRDHAPADLALGVIARSAGAWQNDKVVCSCSGKTIWEERKEMVTRGMT